MADGTTVPKRSGTLGDLDIRKIPPLSNTASVDYHFFTSSAAPQLGRESSFHLRLQDQRCTDAAQSTARSDQVDSSFGISQTATGFFDVTTNVMALSSDESPDASAVCRLQLRHAEYRGFFATALNVTGPKVCPGGGVESTAEANPIGNGPGGETAINSTTHQALVADQFGQNSSPSSCRLRRLPVDSTTTGRRHRHEAGPGLGHHGRGRHHPQGNGVGTPTQLGLVGHPNSLTIDPTHNFAYMLADTLLSFIDGRSAVPRHFFSDEWIYPVRWSVEPDRRHERQDVLESSRRGDIDAVRSNPHAAADADYQADFARIPNRRRPPLLPG